MNKDRAIHDHERFIMNEAQCCHIISIKFMNGTIKNIGFIFFENLKQLFAACIMHDFRFWYYISILFHFLFYYYGCRFAIRLAIKLSPHVIEKWTAT